jgi:large subunit ribosomal protein L32
MALPKVKLSKSKKGRRRSHLALALIQIQPCPNCKHMRRPHTVCPNCGHYGAGSGREVIKAKE